MFDLQFLGAGRHRTVYRRGNYVIKIPADLDFGLASNDLEAHIYSKTQDGWYGGIRYARCRMRGYLLVMEYVRLPKTHQELPDWTLSVDCQQVGYNLRGDLVAYDYGF